MSLTTPAIRDAQPGAVLKCHVVRGLELHARKGGKSWLLYYRAPDGTQRRPKIGEWPTLPLEAARAAARDVLGRVARMEDPSLQRQTLRAAPTVADLGAAWLVDCRTRQRPKKARSITEDARNLEKTIYPALGAMKVSAVTQDDVNGLLLRLTDAGKPILANRIRALLSGMFRIAESDTRKWRPRHSNPVRETLKNREAKRRVKVEPHEARAMAVALRELSAAWPQRVAAILIILYAGTRITELVTARWAWLHGNQLILSEHKTDRTGDDRVIFLPRQALALMHSLPRTPDGMIFSGLDVDKLGVVWDKARTMAGCPHLRMQDLRRTFASMAKSSGVSLEQIGELFGHADFSTTEHYAFLYSDAAEKVSQRTADAIETRLLGAPVEGENYESG